MKLEKLFISLIILSLPSLSLGQKKAYILLISIDGYRWDYTEIHNPKFLTEFKKNGLSAKSLIPVFPSHTFPNHLSIITGSTSTEHGIVSNNFYAPDLNKHFSISNPLSLTDHSFYKAQPIWSLAEKEGVKTGIFFWPGSDLILNSHRSSYYKKFNHETKNKEKIDQIINWFKLPKQERPQFVATYFNEIDLVGEMFGPESMETKRAIKQLDLEIERLVTSLKKLNLNLYVFIVSDHGMMKLNENNFELIIKNNYQKKLIENFIIKDLGTHTHLYTKQK